MSDNSKSKNYGINKDSISKDSFWMVKKKLAIGTGLRIEGAAFLSELIEYHNWLLSRGFIEFGGEFYYKQIHTKDDKEKEAISKIRIRSIESNTGIPKHSQDKYIKILKELGLLEVKRKGIPPRLHYRVLFNKISEFENKISNCDEFSSEQEQKFYEQGY